MSRLVQDSRGYSPAWFGEWLKNGAFKNNPVSRLPAARTSATLSFSVITNTIIVRSIAHLPASCCRALPHRALDFACGEDAGIWSSSTTHQAKET
jgi:hypothetical protein